MKTNPRFIAGVALSVIATSVSAAFNDAGTDYSNAEQRAHVWNEALEPIDLVNSILCFTAQFNSTDFANLGPYLVLADEGACFDDEDDGSGGQSSGASNAPSYIKAVSNVTRASNTEPLVVNVWLPDMPDGDESQAIKFKAVISDGASASNPFGSFTFNFDFFDQIEGGTQNGGGEVITVDTVPGNIGFTLYESSVRGSESFSQRASVVMASDRSTGSAVTSFDHGAFGEQSFAMTFNATHVLTQKVTGGIEDLPFQNGDNSGTCLSRTEFDSQVHRYDLYNATTGADVELNSGFPIKYDSDDNGSYDSYGHVGYWGMWTEQENAVANGDTVARDDDGDGTETLYTVVKAPGRLIKNTVKLLALADAAGIRFSYWDDDVFSDGTFDQWVVQYVTDGFYKTGKLTWGESGPTITDISPIAITIPTGQSIHMWSEQLGGSVKYLDGESSLTYYEQSFMNGSEPELAGGSITLNCYDRCPVGTLDSGDLTNYQGAGSPYSTTVTDYNSPITYTFSTSGGNALTLVRTSNSEPVQYNPALTQTAIDNSPHSWGVRSGPMVTSISGITDVWQIYDPDVVTVYYEWETGLQPWNQLTAIKDDQGAMVSFDKPIQFTYQHTTAKDRDGDATYNGQTFMVSYGGNGDFWGIPSEVTPEGRWFPLFGIADGVVMGPNNTEYVIKAREMELTMQAAPDECSTLTIAAPAAAVPNSVTGSADIGSMPVVSGDPSVIAGVNQ